MVEMVIEKHHVKFTVLAIQSTIVQADSTEKALTVDHVATKILSGSPVQDFAERAKKSGG